MNRLNASAIGLGALLAHGFLATICSAAEPVHSAAASQPDYSVQPDSGGKTAIAAAQARVDEARLQVDAEPLAVAKALTALGDAELGNGDYASAEARYTEALQLAEQGVGPNSASLLDILRGLGYAKAASGRHSVAIPHLERALPISRSTFGLFDMNQQGLLRQLAGSLTAMGRGAEAEAYMLYTLRVAERTYGEGDPRSVPDFCEVGDWYSGLGRFREARITFQVALNILEANSRSDDLAAVAPLRAIAGTYMQEASYPAPSPRGTDSRYAAVDATGAELRRKGPQDLSEHGERALQRALEILDAAPGASRRTVVDTLVQTGDWFQTKQMPAEALTYYERAWRMIAVEPDLLGTRAQLDSPVRVYYVVPLVATRNLALAEEQVDIRYVQMEFEVRADGAVANARVVDHNASKRLVAGALSAIRAARFRPKFIDGEPVSTPAMSHREVFRIRKQGATEAVK